ncbi:MAG: aconitate hydratase AcnA [Alphaproteobacteria bacterium]|nr:MAG: aconitate hydratase AcnA [Alphaproteobacteria bacterium]
MAEIGHDSLNTLSELEVGGKRYRYFSLEKAAGEIGDISRLPFSLKVLLENLLRFEDGRSVTTEDIAALAGWLKERRSDREIAYRPARVLMQDFTGVPAVVDLASMRDAMTRLGADPKKINPLAPVDLVIDHSVMVDVFGRTDAYERNVEREYERNRERYEFLRWGQNAFDDFRVVPPGTGICHQVNLEYLGRTVWTAEVNGETIAFPDTVVGTDSHTTMINALAVLGWGVGGIEAEAAMLGQPISMLIPEVIGFRMTGRLPEGATATDLVLRVTQMLRERGVVGKFVEYFGDGLAHLSVADKATISNMAPEYGATCGFFPVEQATLDYLRFTGRDEETVALVEAYAKAQRMWRDENTPDPLFTDTLELDLSTVEPAIAGPKRPQDRIALKDAATTFTKALDETFGKGGEANRRVAVESENFDLGHGDVVIAAITSCTNTSNPSVMLAAGVLARNAVAKGLATKPWVKTSLAPGSQVVSDYLEKAGLQDDLDALGFELVGYGCTTCIGNSGPLPPVISKTINDHDLVACSVLSGNRNFEGRISPDVRANFLASPPLVVAYAIAGSLKVDLMNDPIGFDREGAPVYLKDIWPSSKEVEDCVSRAVTSEMFRSRYAHVFEGDARWRAIPVSGGTTYEWNPDSTYVRNPPFFEGMGPEPDPVTDIAGARMLALLGDSVTTDHISPAGAIPPDSPAGRYLIEHGVAPKDFNSYGSRRGNHEVMMRGTFANIRLRNLMAPGTEGGVTIHYPSGEQMAIYDAAMRYCEEGVPLVVVAGREYGTGSSRDWAAKGTRLLGVKAVIAESFERIHRSNLIGMGVLPLQFKDGDNRESLGLTGTETFDLAGIAGGITPGQDIACTIHYDDGRSREISLLCRIDTADEAAYYEHGGILHYVLRRLAKS